MAVPHCPWRSQPWIKQTSVIRHRNGSPAQRQEKFEHAKTLAAPNNAVVHENLLMRASTRHARRGVL